jgi:DNA-binding response OmpR family regulator
MPLVNVKVIEGVFSDTQMSSKNVWGHRYEGGSNVVDVVIRSLRKKLAERASMIETVRGVGYRFRPR